MVMRKHQRYFPTFSPTGALLPAFITVANGPVDVAAVAAGNEAVLRARFEDAAFFYKEDLKQPLEAFRCVRAGLGGGGRGAVGWGIFGLLFAVFSNQDRNPIPKPNPKPQTTKPTGPSWPAPSSKKTWARSSTNPTASSH